MTGPMRIETDRRYRAIVVGLLLVFAASLFYYLLAFRQADPDTFWHIATGRYIVEHRLIPTTDVFSWYGIEHNLSWMPQSWLFGVIAYTVWSLGGFQLLYVATAVAGAVAVGLVYWLLARRAGNGILTIVLGVLCAAGLAPSMAPRPQVLTYVLIVGLALLLEHEKWWWAVPVVLIGVNMHGPVYPVYLAVVAFYTLPKRWPVLAVCAATVLATPFGLSMLPNPFLSLWGPGYSAIQEFGAVAPIDWPVYLTALLLILFLLDRETIRPRDLVSLAILIVLSLAAGRHMVFMYLLALPLAAPYLRMPSERGSAARRALPDNSTGSGSPPRRSTAVASPRAPAIRLLDWALVAVLTCGSLLYVIRAVAHPIDPLRGYPVQASQYLRAHDINRYFNEWGDGGFLIFTGMKPLMDGRMEQYFPYPGRPSVALGPEFLSVAGLEVDCRPFLNKYRITHLLVRESSPLTRVLEQSQEFREVYRDGVFAIYQYTPSARPAALSAP